MLNDYEIKVKMDRFFKVREFAAILHIHPQTVLSMIKKGRLHPINVGSEKKPTYLIPEDDILRLRAEAFHLDND